jgi:hypothetical protein
MPKPRTKDTQEQQIRDIFAAVFQDFLKGNSLNLRLSGCCTRKGSVWGFKCCEKCRNTAFLLGDSAIWPNILYLTYSAVTLP